MDFVGWPRWCSTWRIPPNERNSSEASLAKSSYPAPDAAFDTIPCNASVWVFRASEPARRSGLARTPLRWKSSIGLSYPRPKAGDTAPSIRISYRGRRDLHMGRPLPVHRDHFSRKKVEIVVRDHPVGHVRREPDMARELARADPHHQAAVDACDRKLELGGRKIHVLGRDEIVQAATQARRALEDFRDEHRATRLRGPENLAGRRGGMRSARVAIQE